MLAARSASRLLPRRAVVFGGRRAASSLYWPDPWGRPASEVGAARLIDPGEVDSWQFGRQGGDRSRPDVWVRVRQEMPGYMCPACRTTFRKWTHLLGHWRLTNHVQVPAQALLTRLDKSGKPIGWLRRAMAEHKLPPSRRETACLLLLPYGAAHLWLRPAAFLLPPEEAALEQLRFEEELSRAPPTALRRALLTRERKAMARRSGGARRPGCRGGEASERLECERLAHDPGVLL